VVLVGGFGTRLSPLTLTTPKQMLPIVDRPMIEHVLAHLRSHGVDDAVLSLGYRPDAFTEAYPDGVAAGVRLHYAAEPEPLGTAGAIRFAARHAGIDERFVVGNGDILTDLDIGALVDLHERRNAEATVALQRVEDPSRYGVVATNGDGRVRAFVEKPPPGTAPSDLVNAGTYVLEPSVLDRIPEGRAVSIEREVFPAMADDGTLFAMAGDTYWIDAGTPAEYLVAQLDLLDGRRGPAAKGVDPDAKIADGAAVTRAVVGADAVVEAGARVADAVLLPGAVVRAGALVTGSIVGRGAEVGPGAVVVELSVVGDDEVVAPGEVLTGERRPRPRS
jgi:mannose-1-phosphate guanylyltransferase